MSVVCVSFRCNIFIGVRIIKEMPGSVASGTPCINETVLYRARVAVYFEIHKSALLHSVGRMYTF